MTESQNGNGSPLQGGPQQGTQVQVAILGQYIKDISFESPAIRKLMTQQAEQPTLNLEMNVDPQPVGPSVYESTITFSAKAESKSVGVIFELELAYAGIFRIENAPPEALEAILNIQAPSLLFPFVRRIVADMTRDGGIMPPLMLDPVDFGMLYARKKMSAGGMGTA